jgi:uncharacterized protein
MELAATIHTPRPVTQADRIKTVDLIRGFALLGILLMNIPALVLIGMHGIKFLPGRMIAKIIIP